MDALADLGGMRGWGPVQRPGPEPVFGEAWEARAFAMAVLSMRMSGTNLDAFRHALERLPIDDYLLDGYYGRWLHAAELLLTDSSIIAEGAVDARVRRNAGEDVEEPPAPEPNKPDYAPTAAGSLRDVDTVPKFMVGDRVRTRDLHPSGHTKFARYVRRREGVVAAVRPAALLPDTHAHFQGENPQHVYSVTFHSHELWGPDAEDFELNIDLFESYLEAPK
jgi:nitrile hydratase subunit beta